MYHTPPKLWSNYLAGFQLLPGIYKQSEKQCEGAQWLSGSVVECLTRDRGVAGSSLTCVTALCLSVQPGKTCPNITENLLTGM